MGEGVADEGQAPHDVAAEYAEATPVSSTATRARCMNSNWSGSVR